MKKEKLGLEKVDKHVKELCKNSEFKKLYKEEKKRLKKIGIPLNKYVIQIKQLAKKYGYKLSGKITLELSDGDKWIYEFDNNGERE